MKPPALVDGRYRIREAIGAGSYGKVYRASDLAGDKDSEEVVIKIERSVSTRASPSILRHEFAVLNQLVRVEGISHALWFGEEGGRNMLVLDRLGPSLEQVFNACNRTFTLYTIADVAEQLIDCLESIHDHHFIHRDIKPSNILIGCGSQSHHVYLIDFSHAAQYRHRKTRLHHCFRQNLPFVGTPSFAPINGHLGHEQSRRDDLESLAYVVIHLYCGILPWAKGLPVGDVNAVLEQKQRVDILLPNIPTEVKMFLDYAKNLEYSSKPDYNYVRGLMQALRSRSKQPTGTKAEWVAARDVCRGKQGPSAGASRRNITNVKSAKSRLLPSVTLNPPRRSARIRRQLTAHRRSSVRP